MFVQLAFLEGGQIGRYYGKAARKSCILSRVLKKKMTKQDFSVSIKGHLAMLPNVPGMQEGVLLTEGAGGGRGRSCRF